MFYKISQSQNWRWTFENWEETFHRDFLLLICKLFIFLLSKPLQLHSTFRSRNLSRFHALQFASICSNRSVAHSSPEHLGHKGILPLSFSLYLSLCHRVSPYRKEKNRIQQALSRLSNSRVQLVNPSSVATSRRLYARAITQLPAGWWRVNSEYSSAGYQRSIFLFICKTIAHACKWSGWSAGDEGERTPITADSMTRNASLSLSLSLARIP